MFTKTWLPVVTKYYALPEDCWSHPDSILNEARAALEVAKAERETQAQAKPDRLKDLPNLRLATERMLKSRYRNRRVSSDSWFCRSL